MPRKTPCSSRPEQLSLIDLIASDRLSDDRRTALKGLLASKPAGHWRGMDIVPPGSLLDRVAELFQRTTDFPLEVPVFLTLNSLAAYLLDRDVVIEVAGTRMRPDLWTTILAPSGSGKTLSTTVISATMPLRQFPQTTTAATFMQQLAEHNRGAWFQDEWAQVLKRIETQSYAEELRDYLLRLYDNKPLSRTTMKGSIVVEDPALVIVGTSVPETFLSAVSAESMLDGFMQRFQYVVGDPDPARPASLFPIYRTMEPGNLAPLAAAWQALEAKPLHPIYRTSTEAEDSYVIAFRQAFARHESMPTSFFRRVMWRAMKYALVYHFLLGKAEEVIDAEDVGWAARVSALHLSDARRLLDAYDLNELETLARKAESLRDRLGRLPTCRDLISGVRGIRNAATARFILELLEPARSDKSN